MNFEPVAGPLLTVVQRFDRALSATSTVFLILANACLGLMLFGTLVTITLRLFDVSYYWIWPWTMQFFVWMSFIGFFVVYRLGKDIAVDFLVLRIGPPAMVATRYMVAGLIMTVMGVMLWQMPTILESQVGVIDGVVTPWGELERYTLSVPLAVSCALIFLNAFLDILKALAGVPEPLPSHATDPDT
jgi:TRAP-type C4-dicarboxylate transport system permease small subunit